jgi:hypothetical protein
MSQTVPVDRRAGMKLYAEAESPAAARERAGAEVEAKPG